VEAGAAQEFTTESRSKTMISVQLKSQVCQRVVCACPHVRTPKHAREKRSDERENVRQLAKNSTSTLGVHGNAIKMLSLMQHGNK
jgi:hypothetical protein